MSKTWTMRDGTEIAIKDMDDRHLMNTIKMLERNAPMMLEADILTLAGADPQGEAAQDAVDWELRMAMDMTTREYLYQYTPYKTLVWHAKRRGLMEIGAHSALNNGSGNTKAPRSHD